MYEISTQKDEDVGIKNNIPIGRPMVLRTIYILDKNGNAVPIGVPGELYIGGYCLARGYLNRPDLTSEKFIPDPFSKNPGARLYRTGDLARYLPDGNIDFIGRTDHQVKVRGFRIELGEIESVLNQNQSLKEGVVILREDIPGDKRLIAYLVPGNGNERALDTVEIRNFMREKLPEYMIPTAFVQLDKIPRTLIGKVDRKALPAPDNDRAELIREYIAPRNPVEEMIANLWAETLGVERVGMNDNFFDLGGHSLMATQIVTRLKKSFHVDIPLRNLFEAPTVANLALSIAEAQAEEIDNAQLDQMLDELEGLSDEEVEKLLNEEIQN
jgi:acyl carrier protein